MFTKELETLAKAIANQESNVVGRVEVMSGGAVLGTALIKWLKDGEEDIKVARAVVQAVWPRVCEGRSLVRSPVHSAWATSCETKLELAARVESWMRVNNTRCERHLIKLGYFCPGCQHGLCTVCNDIESRIQCPMCQNLFHKYQAKTSIHGNANSLEQDVSTFIPWENNGSRGNGSRLCT